MKGKVPNDEIETHYPCYFGCQETT